MQKPHKFEYNIRKTANPSIWSASSYCSPLNMERLYEPFIKNRKIKTIIRIAFRKNIASLGIMVAQLRGSAKTPRTITVLFYIERFNGALN